jgi:hypothetical protein
MTDQRLRLAVQTHERHIGQLKECEREIVGSDGGANQDIRLRGRRQLQEVQSSRPDLFGCISMRGIRGTMYM